MLPAFAAPSGSISSPSANQVYTTPTAVTVGVSATSGTSKGLKSLQVSGSGPSYQQLLWCQPTPDCTGGSLSQRTYSGSFSWDLSTLASNGNYTLTLQVTDGDGSLATKAVTVVLDVPPKVPQIDSIQSFSDADGSGVDIKWKANTEPDIREYQVLRTGPGQSTPADPMGGPVSASNPSATQGCSLSQDKATYECVDRSFPAAGYGGSYTYQVTAWRASSRQVSQCPKTTDYCVRSADPTPDQQRRVSINEAPTPPPPAPPPSVQGNRITQGGGSSGASGGGSSGDGGGAIAGENPFYSGPPPGKIPYTAPTVLVPGGSLRPVTTQAAGQQVAQPLDVRRQLLPVAAGLFALLAALHMRRALRRR